VGVRKGLENGMQMANLASKASNMIFKFFFKGKAPPPAYLSSSFARSSRPNLHQGCRKTTCFQQHLALQSQRDVQYVTYPVCNHQLSALASRRDYSLIVKDLSFKDQWSDGLSLSSLVNSEITCLRIAPRWPILAHHIFFSSPSPSTFPHYQPVMMRQRSSPKQQTSNWGGGRGEGRKLSLFSTDAPRLFNEILHLHVSLFLSLSLSL
jgi:hypothetical protein